MKLMATTALVQTAVFDVARWEQDAEFGVFPQGARAKDAVFAPLLPSEPVLVGGKRYLFKRSKRSYPDQFWGEVIAYRVGCLLGRIGRSTARAAVSHPGTGFEPHANPRLLARVVGSP